MAFQGQACDNVPVEALQYLIGRRSSQVLNTTTPCS